MKHLEKGSCGPEGDEQASRQMKLLNGWTLLFANSPLDQCLEQVISRSMCNVTEDSYPAKLASVLITVMNIKKCELS